MAIFSSELVGLPVLGSDGEKLGRVVQANREAFVVEKGLVYPADFVIGYGHVAGVRDGEVWLALPRRFYLDQAAYLSRSGEGIAVQRQVSTPALLAPPGSVPPDAGFRGALPFAGPAGEGELAEDEGIAPDGVYDER